MQFKNVNIKSRMWLGFGAILSMVVILGGLAFWHSGIIWNNTDYLYNHPFKVNMAVREIETNILGIQRSMKNVVLSENQEELNAAVFDINIRESEVYRLFDTVYAAYLGKKTTIDTALITFKEWKPSRDETIRLCQAGQQKEAVRRNKTIGEQHVAAIISKMNIMKQFAMDRATDFYRSAEKGKNRLFLQLLVIMGIIFILSFAIITAILVGITTPLRSLIHFAEHYGNGQYKTRNQYNSTNELGVLAAAMNRLAETVQFDINVKNSTLEIADVMMSHEEMNSFCRSVLDMLMSKTDSSLGAIYLLNEKSSFFEPYFSCGFVAENLKSFSADSNEGEFGAVLLGKKLIKVTRIPDDSVFVYSTVSGMLRPKEVITIPVMHYDKVIAVVSLASLEAYTFEAMEIIRQSEKNLNMSLIAMLGFERIREYAGALDKQNEQLNFQANELHAQTDELIEQNTELEIQKYQIDEANRLKSQFLSSMSHELRTPLNSVIALSGVLGKRLKDRIPDEEYGYLEIIGRNGKNLLTLINDILDLSRIEAGKTEVQTSSFSLQDVVNDIQGSVQTLVSEKNIELKNLIGNEIPVIISDRPKVHQILQNIIVNAIKFTSTGSVEISAQHSGSTVSVSVKDTGIGIPKDQLPFIFDEFRQVDGTTSRQYGGTGLGLAIVDKLVRKLNARMEVMSEPGLGSTFTVIFPETPSSQGMSPASESALHAAYPAGSSIPELDTFEASEKNILIVEDSDSAILQLTMILKDQGYQDDIARNGLEALAAVKVKIPDAIILDLMMPGMDGFEVLEQMRATHEGATIPVIILTAMYLKPEDLGRLTKNHIHQLVQKGDINKNQLLSIVRAMLFPQESTGQVNKTLPVPRVKTNGRGKILIIEDNPDNGMTMKVILQEKYDIVITKDGVDGIAKAASLNPDLILLDISLPGMDGFKIFDEIRKHEFLEKTPVIAVTAKAMKGDREHILAHGFDEYISKPIDMVVFEETISKWIV